jgi:hypothetical protein
MINDNESGKRFHFYAIILHMVLFLIGFQVLASEDQFRLFVNDDLKK